MSAERRTSELTASTGAVTPGAGLEWVGAGLPVFIGQAGVGSDGKPLLVGSLSEFRGAFETAKSGHAAFRRSVEVYFARGGGPAYILNVEGLSELPVDRAALTILGEDGGPGYRTGLYALGDLEDVGTVVAPGLLEPRIQSVLAQYVIRKPRLALLLEGKRGSRLHPAIQKRVAAAQPSALVAAWQIARERIAWINTWPPVEEMPGLAVPPAGPAVAALQMAEFDPWRPERMQRAIAGGGETKTFGVRFHDLRDWRRIEGLRRSLDYGTRWTLFEIRDAFLRPRLERELRAFMLGLFDAGLFTGRHPEDAFRLKWQESFEKTPGGATVSLTLSVQACFPAGEAGASTDFEEVTVVDNERSNGREETGETEKTEET